MIERYIGYSLLIMSGLFFENGSVKEIWWSHMIAILLLLIALYLIEIKARKK